MKTEKEPAKTTAKGREFQRSITREKKGKCTRVKSNRWFEESEWMTTSDRFSTEREVKRWIQAGMAMQVALDSTEIDMSTAT